MLTGKLVRLRPFEPEDAATVWRWNQDPEVTRWLDTGHPESLAQLTARFAERDRNSYDHVLLAVEERESGRLVGLVRLADAAPETGDAELGLHLGERDRWGRGDGTEATRLVCRYGFEAMRLHRITLWVAAANAAALRVYARVGFVEKGRARESFRRDGRWHDMVLEGELRA